MKVRASVKKRSRRLQNRQKERPGLRYQQKKP